MSRSDNPMLPDRGDGVTRRDFLHDLAVAGLVVAAPGSLAAAVGEASNIARYAHAYTADAQDDHHLEPCQGRVARRERGHDQVGGWPPTLVRPTGHGVLRQHRHPYHQGCARTPYLGAGTNKICTDG